MLDKLHALYDFIPPDRSEYSEYGLELWERKEKLIVLQFGYANNVFTFQGAYLSDYSTQDNVEKWYFKRPRAARDVSDFPTIFLSRDGLLAQGVLSLDGDAMSKWVGIIQNCVKQEPRLNSLLDCITEAAQPLLTAIDEYTNPMPKQLFILTLTINDEPIGHSELFTQIRENAKTNRFSDFYSLNKEQHRVTDKACSICGRRGCEVWGYTSIFNFYTAKTEWAPNAGGFHPKSAWKNFPCCPDCAKKMTISKHFVEKYLHYKFCRLDYFLIPEFLIDTEENRLMMEYLIDPETAVNQFSLSKQAIKQITGDKREILNLLGEMGNQANFTLFFYESDKQKFSVLQTVEDVYPDQFKALYEAKEVVDRNTVFHHVRKDKETDEVENLEFNFTVLSHIFPISDSRNGDYTKVFLLFVRDIFLQKQIDYRYLYKRIMVTVYATGTSRPINYYAVLEAYMLLLLLIQLRCITTAIINEKEVRVDSRYQSFFDEQSIFFNSNAKKAVFLLGVLCQHLLDIEYRERNSQPFRKKLNGMKLNDKMIRKLFTEIIEKLNQKDQNYYRVLETEVAQLLLCSDLTQLSNDEMSFVFSLGMTLNKRFKDNENKEENHDTQAQ